MAVTQHSAELCALLVNDVFGELPSRLLATLFIKGRCNVGQLAQHTALTTRYVRSGLSVLVQHNLVYHYMDKDSRLTHYEVNPETTYNLIRAGKIVEVIGRQYGRSEQEIVQNLMTVGHASISDLAHAFRARNHGQLDFELPEASRERYGVQSPANGYPANDGDGYSSQAICSTPQLEDTVCRLLKADVLEVIDAASFRNPEEVIEEIQQKFKKAVSSAKTAKQKTELQQNMVKELWRARDQNKSMKRGLENGTTIGAKRQKLVNGRAGRHAFSGGESHKLDPGIIVRINYEKCLVDLRNERLVRFAADTIGESTSLVYEALLRLLTRSLPRCHQDARMDSAVIDMDETPATRQPIVTTLELFDHLDSSVNVFAGIGKADKSKIHVDTAEQIRRTAMLIDTDTDDSDSSEPVRIHKLEPLVSDDSEAESEGDDDILPFEPTNGENCQQNGGVRHTRVKFEEPPVAKEERIDMLRQHLLLLGENKHGFVRHCGTFGRGQWTVDFEYLIQRLRQAEIDSVVEASFGRHGLRLAKILQEHGKLDEKTLASKALLKRQDVQGKMLGLQKGGFVDVQEVPKDNSRLATRTMFFWFFDASRTQKYLVENVYKTMLRCLQTLEVERHRDKDLLAFVHRTDVKDREEEVMTPEHYSKYSRHLDLQQKLLGQVMRLDDIVAILKDY